METPQTEHNMFRDKILKKIQDFQETCISSASLLSEEEIAQLNTNPEDFNEWFVNTCSSFIDNEISSIPENHLSSRGKIWALSDLHLPSSSNHTMDKFNSGPIIWTDHPIRMMNNIKRLIKPNDILLVPGDISWANRIDQIKPDLEYIKSIPCKVILSPGNHDHWATKPKKFLNLLPQNAEWLGSNCFRIGNVAIIAQRFWDYPGVFPWPDNFPQKDGDPIKIFNREMSSIKEKLKLLPLDDKIIKIVMLHFPPISADAQSNELTKLFALYNVNYCIYGHVHNQLQKVPAGNCIVDGIKFQLASSDYVDFCPIEVCDFISY